MGTALSPSNIHGRFLYMVGIKGTGMIALAEVLLARGARIEGCDVAEEFPTDILVKRLKIPTVVGFQEHNLPDDVSGVIHSSAYSREETPILCEAVRRGLPLWEYPEVLGALSRGTIAAGVSGSHGKTTSTALIGVQLQALNLPATVITGASVTDFGDSPVMANGDRILVAETCEYRRNFLNYQPNLVMITGVELDHLDYYADLSDIIEAFRQFAFRLPQGGILVYCSSQPGSVEVVRLLRKERRDIEYIPYGLGGDGRYGIGDTQCGPGSTSFRLNGWERVFSINLPGIHSAENASGAIAVADSLLTIIRGDGLCPEELDTVAGSLARFSGIKRRSEILGEINGILFVDDYGHHPTAIKSTLTGLRSRYPDRRLVVDFMSHTYSRTSALFEEFSGCFSAADILILHKIYGSARELYGKSRERDGRALFEAINGRRQSVYYTDNPEDGVELCADLLGPGDLFLTLGAGNNWLIGPRLMEHFGASHGRPTGSS